eukprot:tig00021352_g20689.t1
MVRPLIDPPKQDGPPPGGFKVIKFQRNLPTGGPSALALFGFFGAMCVGGLAVVAHYNQQASRALGDVQILRTPDILYDKELSAFKQSMDIVTEGRRRTLAGLKAQAEVTKPE